MPYHSHGLPEELYDEIIGNLWGDISSLKACSLANRSMVIPSQKRLFYCIALRAPLVQYLLIDDRTFDNGICGTSYNFWKLLVESPHIANYVTSLHIIDKISHYQPTCNKVEAPVFGSSHEEADDGLQYVGYKLESGEDVSLDVPVKLPPTCCGKFHDGDARFQEWLPNDKFLPLCAPLLHKLKALIINSDLIWHHLSGRVVLTLLNLVQLRSLSYLRIMGGIRFNFIISRAMGENVKHLAFNGYPEKESALRLPHPPLTSTYLSSLWVYSSRFLSASATSRIKFNRLRKLVVEVDDPSDYVTISSVLRGCNETLEDLEIALSYEPYETTNDDDECIDFSKLTTLQRFVVRFTFLYGEDETHFGWLSRTLRSIYSTAVSQSLRILSIWVLYLDTDSLAVTDISHWSVAFDALMVEDELNNLRKLEILIDAFSSHGMDKVVEMLHNSRDIARLRSRSNLVVDIRGPFPTPQFAPDVRWETCDWNKWGSYSL